MDRSHKEASTASVVGKSSATEHGGALAQHDCRGRRIQATLAPRGASRRRRPRRRPRRPRRRRGGGTAPEATPPAAADARTPQAVDARQRARLAAAAATPETAAARSARATATARTVLHGAAAAAQAGAAASAHVAASERIATDGLGSIRTYPDDAPLQLPESHRRRFYEALQRAGMRDTRSNPLRLSPHASAEELVQAMRQNGTASVGLGSLLERCNAESSGATSPVPERSDRLRLLQEAMQTR